jgi:MFS superfamily sulfate permease-like transporter
MSEVRRQPPGLFLERTELAWRRSLLNVTVVGLLAASSAVLRWPGGLAVPALLVLVVAIGVVALVSRQRAQALEQCPTDDPAASEAPAACRVTTAKVWLMTAAALAVTVVSLATTTAG